MQTKLTLRLEDELIKQAKARAFEQGKSLSQLVADYFMTFSHTRAKQDNAPVTRSLRGILKDSDLDEEDYKVHLEEKYL